HGRASLRAAALDVVEAGLEALDPARAVLETVCLEGEQLHVAERTYALGLEDRVLVAGAGKASLAIAAALEELLGPRLDGGLVVVRYDQGGALERAEVAHASHPLPGPAPFAAGGRRLGLPVGAPANGLLPPCVP